MFGTVEVFAAGRQTYATSRKAMLLQAVRRGDLDWSPVLVDVMFAGLSSGLQHTFCVHQADPAGWPDETDYVRSARAQIVRAGAAPAWAAALRDRWLATGDPYGSSETIQSADGEVIYLVDAATRALNPGAAQAWRRIFSMLGQPVGMWSAGSSGFELFDLGFVDEAREAASRLHSRLSGLKLDLIISDSPEAVTMLLATWTQWNLSLDIPVQHTSQWLAERLRSRPERAKVSGLRLTFHDPSCLARYQAETEAPRAALRQLGIDVVEMLRHGAEALPSGSYYGLLPGAWAADIPRDRIASARAAGADGIITASPFDYHNLQGDLPVMDLGEIAAQRLGDTGS
jgi:Fe-S oxidoreductase